MQTQGSGTHRSGTHRRTNLVAPTARTLAAFIALTPITLSACGHLGILKDKPGSTQATQTQADDAPVNASLTALSDNQEPIELQRIDPEIQAADSASVEDSARMIEDYLSGLDQAADDTAERAPQTDVTEIATIATDETQVLSESELSTDQPVGIEDPALEIAQSDPDNTTSSDDDGLFSLSGAIQEHGFSDSSKQAPSSDPQLIDTQPVIVDPEDRKAELVAELVDVLSQMTREREDPASSAIALAALDSMGTGTLEELERDGVLSRAEMATLSAARDMLSSIASSGSIASPSSVGDVLERIQRELDQAAGLRVMRAELCTEVLGFGRFEPFASNRFAAGAAHPVIIYTEIDRFGYRELSGQDGEPRYEVELTQRLELYHIADDLNTWNRASEKIVETSRNKVRDFYLTNQITLPSTLGAGRYHLKVVMRDLVSDSVAEKVIPIEILAR